MLKTGVVLSIQKNKAYMVTPDGEFVKVKIKGSLPKVGETFSGELSKNFSFPKMPIAAASIAIMLLFSGTAYAYYTPATSVIVDINPSIMLKLNAFNRIIDSSSLNKDGEKILSELKLKNKSINEALKVIIDEAKKDNFINENFIKSDKAVTVLVDSKNDKDLDLVTFEKYMNDTGVNVRINSNGKEIKADIKNTSKENSNGSPSKQGVDKDKKSNNNQNKTTPSANSGDKKETPGNSNSSNKNSNEKNNENNGNGKDKNKKSDDDTTNNDSKKNDSSSESIDSSTVNISNTNNGNGRSNNGNNKSHKEKDKEKKESGH